MYAVVDHLQFNKPVDDFRNIVKDNGMVILSKHPGFVDLHFVKVDDNNATLIVVWEDASSAEAVSRSFGPAWFATYFEPFLVNKGSRKAGEIIATTFKKRSGIQS